jgi:hypothetical protein
MTRECHVRFCEGLWVKLPRSTLHFSKACTINDLECGKNDLVGVKFMGLEIP